MIASSFGFQGGSGNSTPTGVQSVTGLATDNTDPQNPIVQLSLDSTLIGDGTPTHPLGVAPIVVTYPFIISTTADNGTAVTGTTANTISRSLLIPANTFNTNGMLEVVARSFKTGSNGTQSIRVYKNTTNSLTGATLIGIFLSNSPNWFQQSQRTFRINSNVLSGLGANTSSTSDFTFTSSTSSTPFTTSVDNYIIFAIQLNNALDSAVFEMARLVKYS